LSGLSQLVVYVYPMAKWVSFRAVAEAHVAQLKRWYQVQSFDGEAFATAYTVLLYTYSAPIRTGTGVEMDAERAADRLHTILDNMDDYRARAAEYAAGRIREEFTWSRVGQTLKEIAGRYIYEFGGRSVVVGRAGQA
jgi:hypothetical protein